MTLLFTHIRKLTKSHHRLLLVGIFMIVPFLLVGCGKSDDEKVESANKLILENKFTEAAKEVDDVKSPDAIKLKEELNKAIKDPSAATIQKELRQNAIKAKFEKQHLSAWDGSSRSLEDYIKKHMNDPKSYEHIETKYRIDYDTGVATIVTKFRGKNAFGGVVVNNCIATQNIESGQLLEAQFIQ